MQVKSKKKFKLRPLSEVNRRFVFGDGVHTSQYWDFYRDGVSVSGMTTWLNCREQFRLAYVEGLESGNYARAAEWGSFYHYLHQRWIDGQGEGSVGRWLAEYRKQWAEEHPDTLPKDKEAQETSYACAMAVFKTYRERYETDPQRDWVSTEEKFEFPVELPDGRKSKLRGFMDGVWKDHNGVYLHEMKTKGRMELEQIEQGLWIDLQVMTYAWLLRRQWPHRKIAVQYDLVRQPGTFPHKGETLTGYGSRVTKEVAKKPEYYFARIDLKIPNDDIDQFEKTMLMPILMDIADWADGKLRHYPNPDALTTKYGLARMYWAIVSNDRTNLKRRKPVQTKKVK